MRAGFLGTMVVSIGATLTACAAPAATPAPPDRSEATPALTESPAPVSTTLVATVPIATRAVPTATPPLRATPTPPPSPTASPVPMAGIQPASGRHTGPRSASAIAISPDGRTVVAANPDSNSVSLLDAESLALIAEVGVGADPRTVDMSPDSTFALVANHGDGSVSAVDLLEAREVARWPVGPMPYGVVTDGRFAWVTEAALGNVARLDLGSGRVTGRLNLAPFPTGMALNADGSLLLITHLLSGEVTAIDVASWKVVSQVKTGLDTNLSQFVAIASTGSKAYLPQTRSNATNRALLFDTTVFPVVNVLDLERLAVLPGERITLDTADQPVSMPFAVAVTPDGSTILVANAGSDDVSIIDLRSGRATANVKVGSNPRGIVISADGGRAFLNNVLDGTVSTFLLASPGDVLSIRVTTIPLAPVILEGKKIFNAAREPDLAADRWIACAVCHFDGGHDGRTWLGFPDGPRNTPALFGVADTAPFHWSGDLDELQDVEITIRNIQAGTGLIDGALHDTLGPANAGRSEALDALATYLASLAVQRSPYRASADILARGRTLFERAGCAACHVPGRFTDGKLHDVATGDPRVERNPHGRGTSFDTPSLRGIWMTAPYFHDGSAATLEDVLRRGSVHGALDGATEQEREDLIAYLLSLP